MADKPNNSNIPINPTIGQEEVKWAQDYYNIQKEIEHANKNANDALLKQFGIRKDISLNIIENLKHSRTLINVIKESKEKELEHYRKMVLESGAKREEMENFHKGLVRQREDYEMQLKLLQNMRTAGWMPIVLVASKVWSLFKSLDTAAWEFRKAMGMTRGPAEQIRKISERIAIDFMHVGVNAGDAYEAIVNLGKEMGSVHFVSSDLVKTTAILKAQLGVAADHSTGFFRAMASVSKSTMESQENMAYMTADLAAAAGVPLDSIMSDISKASGHTLTMMSRLPNQIMRSAIELKRMGTSLKDAANSSREILNFTDSVNAEMEASVLLGRSINLQHARELAYRRELEGSAKEILRLSNSINFENLDVFQQEAFARATGKSVDELMRMLQAERQMDAARNNSDPKIRAQVAAYEKLRDSNEAIAKASGENLKSMVQQKANQERMTSINAKLNQLWSKLSEIFLPAVDKFLGFIVDHFDGIITTAALFLMFAKQIGKVLSQVGEKIFFFGDKKNWKWLETVGDYMNKFGTWTEALGGKIGIFGKIGGLITNIFGKIVTPIKWILNHIPGLGAFGNIFKLLGKFVLPVIFAYNVIKRLFKLFNDPNSGKMGFFESIGNAFKLLFSSLIESFFDDFIVGIITGFFGMFGSLGKGFAKMIQGWWDSIKEWLGHSESPIGKMIRIGIEAIGPAIYNALIQPFRNGLAWIAERIPGMGKYADKLRGNIDNSLNKPIESKINNTYVPATTITPNTTKTDGDKKQKSNDESKSSAVVDTSNNLLQDILVAINNLNKNLESGKIGFYIDGQLMSATLARTTEFRNGYGVNRA